MGYAENPLDKLMRNRRRGPLGTRPEEQKKKQSISSH